MGIIQTFPGSPGTGSIANGGKIYAYNAIGTTAVQVALANPARQSITFHNPGTVDLFIGPSVAFQSGNNNTPTTLVPTTSALGGTFRVYGNGGQLTVTGECQGAWQALAASGSTNPLTVMDSNI